MFSIRIVYLYIKQIRNVILYKKVLKGFKNLKNYKKLIYIKMIYNWRILNFNFEELNSGIFENWFKILKYIIIRFESIFWIRNVSNDFKWVPRISKKNQRSFQENRSPELTYVAGK